MRLQKILGFSSAAIFNIFFLTYKIWDKIIHFDVLKQN